MKRPAQQSEELRLAMISLGTDFHQLDEVSSHLGAQIILANAGKGIFHRDFRKRVQIRFAARDKRNIGFKKEIELAGEWALGTARAFGNRVNATARCSAPGNNQTGVAELSSSQENGGSLLHTSNLS